VLSCKRPAEGGFGRVTGTWRDLPGVSLVSSGNSRASSILTSVRYAIGGCLTLRHPGNAPVTAPDPTCSNDSEDLDNADRHHGLSGREESQKQAYMMPAQDGCAAS
jgi:hypothetical protein